jgi:predicted ATP-dependent serine protease
MKHERNCLNCGAKFQGKISKMFCGDACRKYFARHGGVGYSGIIQSNESEKISQKASERFFQEKKITEKKQSAIEIYAYKRLIDLGANIIEGKILERPVKNKINNARPVAPLQVVSAEKSTGQDYRKDNRVILTEPFQDFLGNISYPFRMLVWGMPGHGKSTFCMQLASEIARYFQILYVAGEEALSSSTLLSKQEHTIAPENKRGCFFTNRLPASLQEWESVLLDKTVEKPQLKYAAIFYDSITKLGITPFYVEATANDCKMNYLQSKISHIFVSHAHKDGSTYRGDGSWGHEVDVVIKCNAGEAVIEKNRFGQAGKTYKIF